MKNIIITGGAGFIGSHVVRLFVNKYSDYRIINVDVLTYAGNLENLSDIENAPNYVFERVDIVDAAAVDALFDKYQPEGVIHLAAESHVDRSIKDPLAFVRTNILGTVNLLNSFKRIHEDFQCKRFYHISTDEVYGTLGKEGLFEETTPYDPNSPYSASKASSDHFVRAYGETYNIGGFNEWTNIDLIKVLCAQMDEKLGREKGSSEKLITYVKDRPGHDRRYAIDATKINKELGWAPSVTFEEGLAITIDWYLSNALWLKNVTSGTYQEYYDNMYAKR